MNAEQTKFSKLKEKAENSRIYIAGRIILPIILFVVVYFTNILSIGDWMRHRYYYFYPPKFNEDSNTFNILLLPFERIENEENKDLQLERALMKRFNEIIDDQNLDIEIKYDDRPIYPDSFDEADRIARERNSTLIIYGDYYEI